MDRTLFLDLDSTLWDTRPLYEKAQVALFGKAMPFDQINHWYAYRDFHGDDFYQMFDYALDPKFLGERKLYPGVYDALVAIHDMGFNFHVMSHNTNPRLYEPYKLWLDSILPVKVDFTLFGSRNDKVAEMKKDATAFGIVEDKAETALKALRAGYHTFVKAQPWNKECDVPSVNYFEEWHTVPTLVSMAASSRKGLLV